MIPSKYGGLPGCKFKHLHLFIVFLLILEIGKNDEELAITMSLSTFCEISLKTLILFFKFSFIASITYFVSYKASFKSFK